MPSYYDLATPLPPSTGVVADAITTYLEQPHKTLHTPVLEGMLAATRRTFVRQLMAPRASRIGYESTTTYTHPCARKAWHALHGTPRPPTQSRTLLKFLLGDVVELAVMGIAQLAGLEVGRNNEDLTIRARDGQLIAVHPDGLLHQAGQPPVNVEIKSCDSRTFDRWLSAGGPSNDWGYRTQASVEIQAWREAGLAVEATAFVAVSTGSRQGSVAEWRLPYEPALVDAWHDRRAAATGPIIPPRPYEAVPERVFTKGKTLEAASVADHEFPPTPRYDKRARIHGWDVPTGRNLVPTVPCGYCEYRESCWPGATMSVQNGSPIWTVDRTGATSMLTPLMDGGITLCRAHE